MNCQAQILNKGHNSMSKIMGTIGIYFNTDKEINEKQFKEFKTVIDRYIDKNLSMAFRNIAKNFDFKVDGVHCVYLEDMVYE